MTLASRLRRTCRVHRPEARAGVHRCGTRCTSALACMALAVGVAGLSACTSDPPEETAASTSVRTETKPPHQVARFVSPNGRDDWPGTRKRPWGTLERAIERVYRGQVLYVRGGVYHERLDRLKLHRGRPSHPIQVRAFRGEKPVVHGSIALNRPMYWQISGLDITASPASDTVAGLLKIVGGVGWSWTGSEIWGAGGGTNVLIVGHRDQPSSWELRGNCIHDVANPAGATRISNLSLAQMRPTAGPGRVTRNVLFGGQAESQLAVGSQVGGGPSSVRIDRNTIYAGKVPILLAGDATKVTIERNLVVSGESSALVRWAPHAGQTGNTVLQNLGVGADTFLRPAAEAAIGGPGNVVIPSVSFTNTASCDGFRTAESAAIPYGRYGVG